MSIGLLFCNIYILFSSASIRHILFNNKLTNHVTYIYSHIRLNYNTAYS
ncbi:hypothetical protein M8C21_003790 [Ambrosia artemisiifolia]|uniref:Uncharacterized protein n=1 Tax=Ambrosia artemisiifolia TaxID=4212 RepID=A0AAD5CAP9_AMBAR|nr:hypothetical protein M8C21_003790 [Ambrosia artemisiifolia]